MSMSVSDDSFHRTHLRFLPHAIESRSSLNASHMYPSSAQMNTTLTSKSAGIHGTTEIIEMQNAFAVRTPWNISGDLRTMLRNQFSVVASSQLFPYLFFPKKINHCISFSVNSQGSSKTAS